MACRHLAIETWLDALNMVDYADIFHQYGGVEDLVNITESDIQDLGIENTGHRAKIVSSLRILRDKYENGHESGSGLFSLQCANSTPCSELNSPTASFCDFHGTVVSPEKLQADLQKELASDPSELRSRSWYHGNITRHQAESLVTNNGDFLIRDCISKPGDFVLTCRWKDTPLNFIMNCLIGNCTPETLPTVSYQLEEDTFPSIQHLIFHYQQRDKPVTVASGALLKNPVPRSVPLSYYDTKYGSLINFSASSFITPDQSPKCSPFVTPLTSPASSPNMNRRKVLSIENPVDHKNVSFDDVNNNCDSQKYSPPTSLNNVPIINITPPGGLSKPINLHYQDGQNPSKPVINHVRMGSAPADMFKNSSNGSDDIRLSTPERETIPPAISESDLTHHPLPKPSRIPSFKLKYNQELSLTNVVTEGSSGSPQYKQETKENVVPLSPSSTSDQPILKQSTNNLNILSTGSPNMQRCRRHHHSIVPHSDTFYSDTDQSLPSPRTYQIVARSRSFQSPRENKYRGNNHEAIQTGCKTVPSKCSKSKTARLRPPYNVQLSVGEQEDSDDRYTKENPIRDSDIYEVNYVNMPSKRMTKPLQMTQSKITTQTFKSNLLPKDHKVLDQSVLFNIKTILINKSPKATALHLTKYDVTLTNVAHETDLGLGVTSGLELLTLPQGTQLRQDILQRWDNLRMFTLATLLTSETVNERAKLLSFWIQTCLELKTSAGNLYSFAAIMAALTDQQISHLTDTWLILRQNYTTHAFVFDTKLRPEFKSLNDANSELPLKQVCIPYITPVCQLLERDVEFVLQDYFWENDIDPIANAIDVLLKHLDVARVIASQGNLYRVMVKSVLTVINFDPELAQILCPEFHFLLLWGSKGVGVHKKDRLEKLEQIFILLSKKCQASGNDGTEV